MTQFGIAKGQTNLNLSNLLSFDGEPYIAVNPANQNNVVAGWMRVRADGKIWIATKASFDKGQTWSAISFMPHDTLVNGSADVSIAFHNSGIAYISWINFRQSPDTSGAVFVAKSTDGGLTWGTAHKVIGSQDLSDSPFDRPWVAVDNSGGVNDGTLYVTSMTAYWNGGQHHIYLRTSDDEGNTWSSIKQVDTTGFSTGQLTASYGGLGIGKDGKAYIAFLSYDLSVSPYVRYYSVTTNNKGVTFQRNLIGNATISGGSDFTKAWSINANPTINGHAILSWVDKRNGDYDILISQTLDGGTSWSAPKRVNDDAINNGIEQDMVWASFSPFGKFGIAWRDRRLNGTGITVPFDIYATVALDTALSFSPNTKITSVASPYFAVPQGNSFIGVAMSDSIMYLNWGDYRNSPDWDIYFHKNDISNITNSINNINNSNNFIKIYPNPGKDILNFQISSTNSVVKAEIIIYNTQGQIVKSVNLNNQTGQVDVSNLPNGAYFLYLRNDTIFISNTTFIKSN